MKIGENIKAARMAKGMTRNQLASKADVTSGTIYNIESGRTFPRHYTAAAVANALGLTLDDLDNGVGM